MLPNDSLISVNKSLLKAKQNSSLGSFKYKKKKCINSWVTFFLSKFEELFFSKELRMDCFLQRFVFFSFSKKHSISFSKKISFELFLWQKKNLRCKTYWDCFRKGWKKKAVQILCSVWRKNYQHCWVFFLWSNELNKGLLK